MTDLSNVSSKELIQKLQHRGYRTEFLFKLRDVEVLLENINECDQPLEDKPSIVLSTENKLDILNTCCSTSMVDDIHTIFNTTVAEYILEHYDNHRYYETKDKL